MPIKGDPNNVGFKRGNNTGRRRTKSDLLPPENPNPTDPLVANIETLDFQFKPMFQEIHARGQGDYAAFASDFLDVELHPGQVKWLHSYSWTNERHLSSGNRFGKASPNFEPVLTPQGWKPIGDVKVGDRVFTQDGTETNVVDVFPQGMIHCYRFVFDDDSSVIVADDHLWSVQTSRERFRKDYNGKNGYRKANETYGQWVTLTAKEILERWGAAPKNKQRVSIPVVRPVHFSKTDVPIDPYLLGLLLGDGGMSQQQISFTTADKELVDAFVERGVAIHGAKSNKYGYSVNAIRGNVKRLGLLGKRSWEKHIPSEYLWNDVETRVEILRGLMDTDGSIQGRSSNVEYCTTSKQLADDVVFLVQSLGGKARVSTKHPHFTHKGELREGRLAYRIDFRIPGINPFRLKRKADLWKEKKRFTHNRILIRIEDAGHYDCTCIRVAHPSHLYVTRDFIVTHNSYVAAVKLLHDAFYQTRDAQYAHLTNEYTALNLSLTIDMAKIVTDYTLRFALDSRMFRRFIVESEIKTAPFPLIPIGTPKTQRTNAFRSEIWARSSAKDARYLLGRKFDLVNYDECARDPRGDKILDEVLRMRLADRNGRLDMTSTAAGRNWFYLAYRRGLEDKNHLQYWSMTGSSYDNPHISAKRVKQNEAVMSEQWKLQNIFGGFADYANVFYRPQIEAMYSAVDYPICTDITKLDTLRIEPDGQYILAIDWALKRDATVMIVARIDDKRTDEFGDDSFRESYPIVFCQGFTVKSSGERYSWDELKTFAVRLHKRFNSASTLFDSTGLAGEVIYQELLTFGFREEQLSGYDFAGGNSQAKDHLIMVAQQALQNETFKFPFVPMTSELVDQLLMYDRDDKLLPTDYVFAFCLLAERLRRTNLPVSEVLSLPLLFAVGSRRLGQGQHPFDHNYSIQGSVSTGSDSKFLNDLLIVTSRGYVPMSEITQ